jgi:ornithine cyclodeaminase/alanine dehydrogenase-like protein (mu-crystallin family)
VENPPVSLITRGDIARTLPIRRCLDLARVAYEATATGGALSSSLGHVRAPAGDFHIKGSGLIVDDRLFVAVKVAAFFDQRPQTIGLPSIVGLIQLFDGTNGQPLAIMESGLITELRTAAGTAVALDQLARRDARRLLVCGAGGQVLRHVEAIAAIRDLETVQLWGRTPARTQATLTEIRTRFPHLHAGLADDLRTATQDADLIACLTPATEPYLQLADIRPGTTVAAVGSDTPEKQELSVDLLASAALVCDFTQQCSEVGELHHAVEAGVMTLPDVRAEIGQVIAGTAPGRQTNEEIVVFDSTGSAVQDAAPAAAAYLAAGSTTKTNLWAA